ncbi:MAG TPA: hypothetical protein VLZ83_06115 [Edaphocola sp.]|nr:hypothetical protein [Edaphocola sp.]
MKTLLFICSTFFAFHAANATVRNVSNAPNAPVNPPYAYNSIQTALDACADNDTLYLHGTNVSYGAVTIDNKQLVIIGSGFGTNLQNSTNQSTIIGTINCINFTGSKNLSLIGLRMEEVRCGNSSTNTVNTLYIERCGIRPNYNNSSDRMRCNTLYLKQCVVAEQVNYDTEFKPIVYSMAMVSNTVLQGKTNFSEVTASIFENNIFKRTHSYYGVSAGSLSFISGTGTLNNNIFLEDYLLNGISGCTFNNNLFVTTTSLSGQNANNNIQGMSAGFVNNAYTYSTLSRGDFSTYVDYHLAAGSAAIGAGMNGTDLGIYGGTSALSKEYPINGVPAMPRVIGMTLQSMSVAPGGQLNVQIQAVNQK